MKRPIVNQNDDSEKDTLLDFDAAFSIQKYCFHRFHHRHRTISIVTILLVVAVFFCLTINSFVKASKDAEPTITIEYVNHHNHYHEEHYSIRQHRKQQQKNRFFAHEQQQEGPKNGIHQLNNQSLLEVESSPHLPPKQVEEKCTQVGKCERCTFSEQKAYEACHATGRWVKFECMMMESETTGSPISLSLSVISSATTLTSAIENETDRKNTESSTISIDMRSCKYTEFDEEFAMVRLQIFCFLIGSLAIASVKKQKRISSSLFEQRKQQGSKRSSNFITENEEEIEFTPMTNQQKEKVPLMEIDDNDHMEII